MALGFAGETLRHRSRDRIVAVSVIRGSARAPEQLFHRLLVERHTSLVESGEEQVLLPLVGVDREASQGQVTGFPMQHLDHVETRRMAAHVEDDPRGWGEQRFRAVHHMLAERMRQAIKESTLDLTAVLVGACSRLGMRLRDQVVSAFQDLGPRWVLQLEGQRRVVEARPTIEHEARERPEPPAHAVELGLGVCELEAQALVHVLVEALEEPAARLVEPRADLLVHLSLQRAKGGVDLFGRPTRLVDAQDTLFEIDTRLDTAEHLVRRAEDSAKEAELLGQKLQDAPVGRVAFVQEVDHDHIVLLAVAVATADALLDALRVPRQVVVHNE